MMEKNSIQKAAWQQLLERLRIELSLPGVTQASIGRHLGVHRSVVHKWLSGFLKGERIPIDTMRQYYEKMNMDTSIFGLVEDEFSEIPWVEATASMGPGSLEDGKKYDSHLSFRTSWLVTRGNPRKMVVVNASGGSMEPTIPDKSVVLVDESDRARHDLVNNAIYLVCYGDSIFLKRLKVSRSGRAEALLSDSDGSEQPLEPDVYFAVQARAIWFGKDL